MTLCTFLTAASAIACSQQPPVPEKTAGAPAQTPAPASAPATKPVAEKQDTAVRAQMRNVKYRFANHVAVLIKTLTGALVPTPGYDYPVMDDKRSFKIHIDAADINIAPADFANVLNSYVFARPNSPLSGISMDIDKHQLKIKGRLRDKGNIRFETIGTLSTTADGRVRLHSEKVKAFRIPVKGLMDAFGIEIDDLITSGKVPGIQAEENDLILDLQQILPPPHIEGAVTGIRLDRDVIATSFGSAEARSAAKPTSGNFMIYQGNRMQFGRLLMNNTDLTMTDLDPADPLDFFLDHFTQQLADGYTKISSTFQLRVFIKDYDKLNRSKSPNPASN